MKGEMLGLLLGYSVAMLLINRICAVCGWPLCVELEARRYLS